MKPDYAQITVEGSLPTAGKKMTIDPDAMAHILRILIDLYSDKELAIIRELSTNAIDSHIMAGVTRPISVQLPGPLSPYLVVQDFGLGLSVDEIHDLFGRYGSSTKRDTNEATGMLGLGSKSPLTYTNTFTMEAVKDGIRAVVAITRDEEGVGNLTVVDTSTTSEGNGVTIRIPTKTGNRIEMKAREFFRYWKPGTVLVGDRDPSGLGDDCIEITPSIFMRKGVRYEDKTSVLVMGNVPYPAPELTASVLGVPHGYSLVAYVPIGSLDFAPSREALQDTRKTRNTVETVTNEFRAGLESAVQKDIDKSLTAFQALKKMHAWLGLYSGRTTPDFTYKGKKLPTQFTCPTKKVQDRYGYSRSEPTQKMIMIEKWGGYRTRGRQYDSVPSLNLDTILSCVFVTGFTLDKVTPTHRKKAGQWVEKQTNQEVARLRYFILLDFLPEGLDLIDADRIVPWDTINAEKLPKTVVTGGTGRIPGSFDLVLGGEKNRHNYGGPQAPDGVPGDKIDQTKPVFWVHSNQQDAMWKLVPILDNFHKAYTIICLQENRLAKFQRENPAIENANTEVKKLAKQLADKMTSDEKKALWLHDQRKDRYYVNFQSFVKQLNDPDLKRMVYLSTIDLTAIKKSRERFSGSADFPTEKVTHADLVEKRYPLATHQHVDDHVIRYVNNEYAHFKATRRP